VWKTEEEEKGVEREEGTKWGNFFPSENNKKPVQNKKTTQYYTSSVAVSCKCPCLHCNGV